MFKFIGFITGYYFFGFFGALLGLFLGSFIDRVRVYGTGGVNPLQNAMRQAVFLETVFISMGKLAKADGRVSEDEIKLGGWYVLPFDEDVIFDRSPSELWQELYNRENSVAL